MRPRLLLATGLLLSAALATPRATADGPAAPPAGHAYATADLPALVEGLGYDAKPLGGGMLGFLVDRPEYTIPVNLSVSADGSKIELYAPLRRWKDVHEVPEDALLGLLRKTVELGPTRAYLIAAPEGGAWVGLVRSLDNRALRPADVRAQIDFLVEHARQTESLWNPERWNATAPATPGMDAGR